MSSPFSPEASKSLQSYSSFKVEEQDVRRAAEHHSFHLLLLNCYAAFFVFFLHLISWSTIFSVTLSVTFTVFTFYQINDDTDRFNGNAMSWILLTFAVVTPIGHAIVMAFRRRENALHSLSTLRATFLQLYTSHAIWGWEYTPGDTIVNGRSKSTVDWLQHSDMTLQEILSLCHDLTRLLTLPNDTRARQKVTVSGREEAARIHVIHAHLLESVTARMGHMAELCEILKREGLPPNESNRIRQWERNCMDAIEKLRVVKMYRTPQGLRSFGRLFSMLLPPFYAPYYAQLARDINSLGTAITFSIFTAVALTALFETISQMEDPFEKSSVLDGVDVTKDLNDGFKPQFFALRNRFFPDAPAFEDQEKLTE